MQLGKHYLVDFIHCRHDIIDDQDQLRTKMLEAVAASKARIIKDVFHKFAPQGVTGVVVIAESHVAIHTWPEHDFAACDIFTCSEKMQVDLLIEMLKTALGAEKAVIKNIPRGF